MSRATKGCYPSWRKVNNKFCFSKALIRKSAGNLRNLRKYKSTFCNKTSRRIFPKNFEVEGLIKGRKLQCSDIRIIGYAFLAIANYNMAP